MPKSRRIVMPCDLNGAMTLFGGKALSWIDEEAAVFSACQMQTTRIVTKMMSGIDFKAPAIAGDIVEIECEVVSVGTTSLTVKCEMRNKTTGKEILTVDKMVFVSLDKFGKPIPHFAEKT